MRRRTPVRQQTGLGQQLGPGANRCHSPGPFRNLADPVQHRIVLQEAPRPEPPRNDKQVDRRQGREIELRQNPQPAGRGDGIEFLGYSENTKRRRLPRDTQRPGGSAGGSSEDPFRELLRDPGGIGTSSGSRSLLCRGRQAGLQRVRRRREPSGPCEQRDAADPLPHAPRLLPIFPDGH